MSRNTTTNLAALALNAEGEIAPDWIQLTPPGPNIDGRDGRKWILPNPETVVAAFRDNGADLPIDFEHATQVKGAKGEEAPAIGWIKDLDVRQGAIWARVDWTDAGSNAIQTKAYRYVSPVFTFTRVAGDILKMVSAGLTNSPNLKMAALNKEGSKEETGMNQAILEALGLKEGASDDDVLTAINKMKTDEATARNRAETPDAAKFVPRADYDLALNKVRDFETADKARSETAIVAAVDAATEAGKIAPASRDYHIAACRQDGGLERFSKMVGGMSEMAGKTDLKGKPGDTATALNKEERDACKALGMTEKEFAAAKNEE